MRSASGRKEKIWERRLLRDFHVVSVAGEGEDREDTIDNGDDRFRKLAILVSKVNAEQDVAGAPSVKRNIKMM